MLALAAAGVDEGVWLRAERQTAGRGRLGRTWSSPAGNLYASTLVRLRPTDPPGASLAFVAAVALQEAVAVHLLTREMEGPRPGGAGVVLKWPNDLLLGDAKLSGILLERTGNAIVIGIGVNLAHHPDLADRVTTSLAAHGVTVDPATFLLTLRDMFAHWLDRWRVEGLASVCTRWLASAHPVGSVLTARLPDGTAVEGRFDGLDPGGALILRLASGERRVIHAADVFLF